MLPELYSSTFAQACKVNFEKFRFAIAGVIFLSIVTDDTNHFYESFGGRDHFDDLRVGTISNQLVISIGCNVFIFKKDRAGGVVVWVDGLYKIY